MSESIRVVLVGHCMADSMYLTRFVRRHLVSAAVERVNSDEELEAVLGQPALLLINRVLDGRFANPSGLDILTQALHGPATPVLISNHDDVQQTAIAAGAPAGFGKGQLGEPGTPEKLIAAASQLAG